VFGRVRALVFGMRAFDWLMVLGAAVLFLGTLFLFGLLAVVTKIVAFAMLLGCCLWALTDQPEAEAQRKSQRGARRLCQRLRLQGLSEEQVREFVCKFAGPHWEAFFEALFGYEAKLTARALRPGQTADPWVKYATWREPVVAWADARLEARRRAREQRHLQRIEAKALEAKGVSRTEASERAAAMAAVLVDQAEEAQQARRAGKEVDLRGMLKTARTGRTTPGAGAARRARRVRDLLNNWFGRRLRFAAGALLFAAGLLWLHQNNLLDKSNPLVGEVQSGRIMSTLGLLSEPAGQPLVVRGVSAQYTAFADSYRVPITGLCLLASAVFFFGWRSSAPALLGAAVAVAGPALGLPEVGGVTPALLGLGVGIVLIVVVGWLLRK
jgi:hypothetical protein